MNPKISTLANVLPASINYSQSVYDDLPRERSINQLISNFFTRLFFCPENIQKIKELLRALVLREMGDTLDISAQSSDDIKSLMETIYIDYSKNPMDITDDMTDSQKNYMYSYYTAEIKRLNEITIRKILPMVMSNIQQYKDYLRDIDTTNMPVLNYPTNVSSAGTKTYSSTLGNF